MKTNETNPRVLLSTLWIVILFNIIIRDLHEFLREGYIEQIMSLDISQEMVLLYGVVAQIPILMILFSRILDDKINRWLNAIAAVITSFGLLSTLPSADMDDILFVCTGIIFLLGVLRVAWKSPRTKTTITSQN